MKTIYHFSCHKIINFNKTHFNTTFFLNCRFDIQKEIQKLKSLIMPQNARDLFHGRGFTLPE